MSLCWFEAPEGGAVPTAAGAQEAPAAPAGARKQVRFLLLFPPLVVFEGLQGTDAARGSATLGLSIPLATIQRVPAAAPPGHRGALHCGPCPSPPGRPALPEAGAGNPQDGGAGVAAAGGCGLRLGRAAAPLPPLPGDARALHPPAGARQSRSEAGGGGAGR